MNAKHCDASLRKLPSTVCVCVYMRMLVDFRTDAPWAHWAHYAALTSAISILCRIPVGLGFFFAREGGEDGGLDKLVRRCREGASASAKVHPRSVHSI